MNIKSKLPGYLTQILKLQPKLKSGRKNYIEKQQKILEVEKIIRKEKSKINN